jgi:transposase InsO family protein
MPGEPQQNGRHQRRHKTLKAETAQPPAATLAAQQRRFDHFRAEFNHERLHEALGQTAPAAVYTPSARPIRSGWKIRLMPTTSNGAGQRRD